MKFKIFTPVATAAAALLVVGQFGCTNEYVEDLNGVCFEDEVLPIFVSNCTQSGCHNSQSHEKGYDLSNYMSIVKKGIKPGNFRNSEIYEVLVKTGGEEAMPPKPYTRLTDEQITTIALWIEEGAKNTTCASTSCDTTGVTFSGSVLPIFKNYCNGCHGGASPSAGIDLTTYAKVKPTVADGSLLGSVRHASGFVPMPENGNKLSNCNISKIQAWVNAGAKND